MFWWLHASARPTPAGATDDRRRIPSSRPGGVGFLLGSAGALAGAVVAGPAGFAFAGRVDVEASRSAIGPLVPAVPGPAHPAGRGVPELGTPTFLTPSNDFYRIDINLTVPQLRAEDAVLRITGMVDRPVAFTFGEIRSMPLVEKTITMTCVSNPVGGPYVSTSNFLGVPLKNLLDRAGVQPGPLSSSVIPLTASRWAPRCSRSATPVRTRCW